MLSKSSCLMKQSRSSTFEEANESSNMTPHNEKTTAKHRRPDFDENASLIGVTLDDLGSPVVKHKHRDGHVSTEPFPESDRIGDPWQEPNTAVLVPKERFGLTRQQHMQRSLDIEAAMIKATSSATGANRAERIKAQAPHLLAAVMEALGGEWETLAKEISDHG